MTVLFLSIFLYVSTLPQTPTVSVSLEGASLKVAWTGPEIRVNHWIGIVPADRPDTFTDLPSTRYQYLLPDAPPVLTFPNPGPGEWEARYFISNSGPVAARSAKLMIAMTEPVPDPGQPLPSPIQEQLLYYEITLPNGTKLEGPTSDTFENLLYRYRNSALLLGASSIRIWKLDIPKPERAADIELSGVVRREIP